MSVGNQYEVLVSDRVRIDSNMPGHVLTLSERPIRTADLQTEIGTVLAGTGKPCAASEQMFYLTLWVARSHLHVLTDFIRTGLTQP